MADLARLQEIIPDDSIELKTLRECSQVLNKALKHPETKLVYFLSKNGVFSDDILEEILTSLENPKTPIRLVQLIKDRVDLDPPMFHKLLAWFKNGGELYAPITKTLEAEFARQQQQSEAPTQQGKKKNIRP